MVDIESFSKSLKTIWINKYMDQNNHGKWKVSFKAELQRCCGDFFFQCNLKREDLDSYFNIPDVFLKEILEIWCELNYEDTLTSQEHFHSQFLWNSSLIRIGQKPVFIQLKWFQKGIFFVKHLLEANRADFLSHADFQSTFWIKVNALEFFGMISRLKQLLKSSVQPQGNNNKKTQPTFATSFFQAQGQADLSIRNSFKERQLNQKRSRQMAQRLLYSTRSANSMAMRL